MAISLFIVLTAVALPASANVTNHIFPISGDTGCDTPTSTGNRADNTYHTYFKSNLETKTALAVDWVVSNAVNGTGFTPVQHTSYSSLTDAYIVDWNVGTSCGINWDIPGDETHGMAVCLTTNAANKCQQFRVLIDTSSINHPATTLKKRRSLLCHEIGHSLGLRHYFTTTSCMNTGLWSNNNKKYYSVHLKDDLKLAY